MSLRSRLASLARRTAASLNRAHATKQIDIRILELEHLSKRVQANSTQRATILNDLGNRFRVPAGPGVRCLASRWAVDMGHLGRPGGEVGSVLALRHGMSTCDARLHLTADVVRAGFRFPVFSRTKQAHADPLNVRLCG